MIINDNVVEKAVEKIINKTIEVGFKNYYFGLRKDSEDYLDGQTPRNSYHWYDNDWDNATKLDGTCATLIDLTLCSFMGYEYYDGEEYKEELNDDLEEMRDIIREAVKINKDYNGEHWYLLIGKETEEGQDENEVIIKDAKVVCKLL